MKIGKKQIFIIKVVLAWIAMVSIISIPLREIYPQSSVKEILWMATWMLLSGLMLIISIAVITLQFQQWKLRKGAIDTQWLWFRSDPPGLSKVKDEATDMEAKVKSQAHKDLNL